MGLLLYKNVVRENLSEKVTLERRSEGKWNQPFDFWEQMQRETSHAQACFFQRRGWGGVREGRGEGLGLFWPLGCPETGKRTITRAQSNRAARSYSLMTVKASPRLALKSSCDCRLSSALVRFLSSLGLCAPVVSGGVGGCSSSEGLLRLRHSPPSILDVPLGVSRPNLPSVSQESHLFLTDEVIFCEG